MSEHVDTLVVGAGLSGIGAVHRLLADCPGRDFRVLEARDAMGGTWDLFRYPGVRSDSDMLTLGYPFRPWTRPHSIAEGAEILDYIRDTAARYGIDEKVEYGQRVVSASWSGPEARWTLRTEAGREWTCSFLYLCTGYYRYSAGHEVDFPGRADFAGRTVHPQQWPDDLDYAGKRVLVIGSGATAVTLVPVLAATAAHVTMVQRSPSFMVSMALRDTLRPKLRRYMSPERAALTARTRNILVNWATFQLARRRPERTARLLRDGVAGQLPEGVPVDPHFTPRYAPGEQRICGVAGGDLFAALRAGTASVATGHIETFTEKGLRLTDGTELAADVIVTATGLVVVAFGEIALTVDGRPVDSGALHIYKHLMFDGLPNLAWCVGYSNASWTMRAELSHRYVCRLLNHMARRRLAVATPTMPAAEDTDDPLLLLTSGYVQRAKAVLPRQGTSRNWRVINNYLLDWPRMRLSRVNDGALRFQRATGT